MTYPYTFLSGTFLHDLDIYLKGSSLRKLADKLEGEMSHSKLHRIVTGKKKDVSVQELCLICAVIGQKPRKYFNRVLF